jgi:hypothetical protein
MQLFVVHRAEFCTITERRACNIWLQFREISIDDTLHP